MYFCFVFIQMVQPTVLKRRHSLKGKNLLLMIDSLKENKRGKLESLKEFVRVNKDTKTDKMSIDEIGKAVKDIMGELAGIVY